MGSNHKLYAKDPWYLAEHMLWNPSKGWGNRWRLRAGRTEAKPDVSKTARKFSVTSVFQQ